MSKEPGTRFLRVRQQHAIPGLTVALSPVAQRFQHRAKTLALFREVVLKPGRVLAVGAADNEIVRFHALQACGQRIGGHPTQGLLKILKATRPMKEQITQ